MRALIVFDTRSGMTEKVGRAIEAGLEASGVETVMKRAGAVTAAELKEAETWIFGSPVHFWGPTGASKRALKAALATGAEGKRFATFDTRYAGFKSPGASGKMAEALKEGGATPVAEPANFVVDGGKGPLAKGEESRATEFGRQLAEKIKG
jgi:flavodoxin